MTEDKGIVFQPRFGPEVVKKLRRLIWKRGELLNLVVLILQSLDLDDIPVLDIEWAVEKVYSTTVKLPSALHAKLKQTAEKRGISMNVLLNSAVSAYEPKPLRKKK